jgi:hypothetical protein
MRFMRMIGMIDITCRYRVLIHAATYKNNSYKNSCMASKRTIQLRSQRLQTLI